MVGKSEFALQSALQYVDVPGYSCLVLRRTWPDLISSGAVLDRFNERMAGKNVKKRDGGRLWIFPSGAKIQFGYVNRPAAKTKFQGAEFQKIIFDEATLFEPEIYEYMLSRNRRPTIPCAICAMPLTRYNRKKGGIVYRHSGNSTDGKKWCDSPLPDPNSIAMYQPAPDGMTVFDIPLQIISTANPGGPGHLFFRNRFIKPGPEKIDDGVFIPSTILDNPYLDKDTYMKNLEHLGPVDKARMLNGDWEIAETGNYFNRGDFEIVEAPPNDDDVVSRVRYWDMAATETKDADYTVGALCSITKDGKWWVEDIKRVRYSPPKVERLIQDTARADANRYGLGVRIYIEQEPGSSGKAVVSHYKRIVLAGYRCDGLRPTGPKEARAGIVVSQVGAHNLNVVMSEWTKDFLDEFSVFPHGVHDDQVDAVSGAFLSLTSVKKPVRLIV